MAVDERPDFAKMEKKWQDRWEKAGVFKAAGDRKKKKCYVLEMFPYPSASGLHMGHIRNYSIGDCIARYKRMKGFDVLYPMGYDAFGLPAENAAIKNKTHPKEYTEKAIEGIKKNQKSLGLSYDWDREIATCLPEYYRWNQWFFLRMLKRGLAYKKKAPVNWCPKCATVLANEQVDDGKCWRCESDVEVKNLEQWFLKITAYAENLLAGLKDIDWPENVKKMQENWIGRSEGTRIEFPIKGSDTKITVFTTRPDTFFGITFLVYAPEHPEVADLVKGTPYEKKVKEFINRVVIKEKFERTSEESEKEGMFIGRYALNPVTGEEIPIYIANFVLMEYGTGAIIAVPAHDQRDFMFAKKYEIPIKIVIQCPFTELKAHELTRAYCEEGTMVNSGEFDGMGSAEAIDEITKFLEKKGCGKAVVEYKLRDWGISRQRYWGTPIPIVYCAKCGTVPVPEKDLPVLLPTDVKFGCEGNPLRSSEKFVNVKCPKCGGPAKRETDTMDTFVDSSWYFLRFCSPHEEKSAFDAKAVKRWMPVDQYIGGVEHAVMHLMYARFFTMVLKDMGLVGFTEPFSRLFNQGIVYKDGHKMSKSFGNAVTQEEIAGKFGIDTARVFLLFVASPESQVEWNDQGIQGAYRFLSRYQSIIQPHAAKGAAGKCKAVKVRDRMLQARIAMTVAKMTEQIEGFQMNLAISTAMDFVNYLHAYEKGEVNAPLFREACLALIKLMSPFAPHVSEELWEAAGMKGFVSVSDWPKPPKADANAMEMESLIGRLKEDMESVVQLSGMTPKEIRLTVSPAWKYRLMERLAAEKEKTRNPGEVMKAVMSDAALRSHGQEISKIVPSAMRNPEKCRAPALSQEEELALIREITPELSVQFSCAVSCEAAEKSQSKKAGQAMPGKPGIEVM